MSGTDLGVNQQSMERILNAFLDSLSRDPKVLRTLADVIRTEATTSGLGYMAASALERIEETIRGIGDASVTKRASRPTNYL